MKRKPARHSDAMQLRPAKLADVDAIVDLENASFSTPHEQFNRRQVRYLIGSAKAEALVAELRGQVMGWGVAIRRRLAGGRREIGRIYGLAVHPEGRGMNIGQALLGRLLNRLSQRGIQRVWLEVRADNIAAIRLYERFGFLADRQLPHYYRRAMHAIRMVRNID